MIKKTKFKKKRFHCFVQSSQKLRGGIHKVRITYFFLFFLRCDSLFIKAKKSSQRFICALMRIKYFIIINNFLYLCSIVRFSVFLNFILYRNSQSTKVDFWIYNFFLAVFFLSLCFIFLFSVFIFKFYKICFYIVHSKQDWIFWPPCFLILQGNWYILSLL